MFKWFKNYRQQKKNELILSEMLKDVRYPAGRSTRELSLAISMVANDTRKVLRNMGARMTTLKGGKEGWTLRKVTKKSD